MHRHRPVPHRHGPGSPPASMIPSLPRTLAAALLLALAPVPGLVGRAPAQDPRAAHPPEESVFGMVVEVESLRPLPSARVVLEPAPSGALPARSGDGSTFLGGTRSVVTGADGRYRLDRLPAGSYRMHVQALGYRSTTLELRVGGRRDSELSVGLRVEPIALEPLRVRSPAAEAEAPYGRAAGITNGGAARLLAERLRQARYPSSDVRALTHGEVQEAVTLGETDLFRALQRLPGVSTRDDYTAEMWTRGAPWDQTAVYFDGVPLFNPLHAAGAFSAVNSDAVGAAFFHPGVQPAELRSGGAGLVEISSRAGAADSLRGAAELSLVSGRLVADGRTGDGRGAWMLAARRSYADLLPPRVVEVLADSVRRIPYVFSDVTARWDQRLGDRFRLEASGIHESDRLQGEIGGVVTATSARWGSSAGRVTLSAPFRGGEARHTLGASRFSARADELEPRPVIDPCPCRAGYDPTRGAYRGGPTDNALAYLFLAGTWSPAGEGDAPHAAAGYRLVWQDARFRTAGLWPYRSAAAPVAARGALRYAVLWAEREWRPSPALRVDGGVRVEAGGDVRGSGPVRVAPHLAARYRAGAGLTFSAAAGRTYQYAQALRPAGPGHDPVAISNVFWTLAGPHVPALRSDLATLGVERWVGEGALASVTAYRRSAAGVAVPDPEPGWVLDRPLSVPARDRAHGVDVSLRRLAGRWTGSASYAFAASELEAGGLRFPSPTARRHALDATALVRVHPSLRLGGAFTAASGAAFTRYQSGLRDCTGRDAASCRYRVHAGEPGAERAPAYRSLDLLGEWSGTVGGWRVSAFAQLHNVLRTDNRGAYQASRLVCGRNASGVCRDPILDPPAEAFLPENNLYLPGLPLVPAVGIRAAF